MRASSQQSPCAFAHTGFLFERQRAAMRQNAFARARNAASAVTKRKSRDDSDTSSSSSDESSSGSEQLPHEATPTPKRRRVVLEGFKRMRVSSPPSGAAQAPATTTNTSTSNATMSDSMMTDDEDAARQAIVRVANEWDARQKQPVPTHWTPAAFRYAGGLDLQLPPADPWCTAIVLFNAPIPRPLPRVELVESGEDAGSLSSDDEQPFVRFEEIPDDEDEPMEID